MNRHEKHLIIVDLDGTILNNDFCTLNPKNKKVLQELQKQGHKICIATGRNYLSALPFYQEIDLDTFLITYNGAYINNPKQIKQEKMVINPMANATIENILNEEIIKENLLNVMVDSIDRTTISTSDDTYYQNIFFNGNSYVKGEVLKNLAGKDCLQLVLELPNNEKTINEVLATLRNKYRSAIAFYCGNKLEAESEGGKILVPNPEKMIIKIRNVIANKGMATE